MIQSIDQVDYGEDDEGQAPDEVEEEDDYEDNEEDDEAINERGFNYFDNNFNQSMPPHLQRPQTSGGAIGGALKAKGGLKAQGGNAFNNTASNMLAQSMNLGNQGMRFP